MSVTAKRLREQMPAGGLFAGQDWLLAGAPLVLPPELRKDLEILGRVCLQFYKAANLLYRQSAEGRQPEWIAQVLDQGKPAEQVALQRSPAFKNELPRVIRPDVLLTENGLAITELDSVPGGIGLTAWLNRAYSAAGCQVLGGPDGMLEGFRSIFPPSAPVRIVVSEESATYRPEMEWLASQLGPERFMVQDGRAEGFQAGDAVYRFFELFDVANVPASARLFELARTGVVRLTPPPKAFLEEKLLFALLWNHNLRVFWHQNLGESFLQKLRRWVPYTWLVDPAPLPPHAAIPGLELTDWHQLKTLSQRERELILKISGFSAEAWGSRGVYLGSDLSAPDWAAAVDKAVGSFARSPHVLMRYARPRLMESTFFVGDQLDRLTGRVRLCPYYFVQGEGDAARAHLGGALATICPADKKIIHGMRDAILAPCAF
jgi:hypothetical protein